MSSAYSPTNNKKSTALFDQHRQLNAKFDEYAGWTMPIYYDSIQIEYRAVLDNCGLFDVSHMGQFFISGANALNFLRYLLPLRIDRLLIGQLQYTPMCNSTGGTVDDLIVYRFGEREFLLVVNAARTSIDWEWLKGQSQRFSDLNIGSAGTQRAKGGFIFNTPVVLENVSALYRVNSIVLMRFESFLTRIGPILMSCKQRYQDNPN